MTKGWPNSIDSWIASLPFVTRRLSVQGNSISITTRRHSIGHTVPFTFNSPMRLRDASHCSIDYSTFIRKHVLVPYADIFCLIPCISLTRTNLISSRFVNNTTFEFYPRFERFGYNSHWWPQFRFLPFIFPYRKRNIYSPRKLPKISHDERYARRYIKIIFRKVFFSKYREKKKERWIHSSHFESFLNASVNSRYNRRRKGPPYTNTRISTRVILIALCAHNG